MTIFTIGHSNYSLQDFFGFLHRFDIHLLVDIRSNPYSKYHPHFTYTLFKKSLEDEHFTYQYLGDKIGGKYSDPNLQFIDGGVDYAKVESLLIFRDGINLLVQLNNDYANIAIMCGEKDPYFCHRFTLISHALSKKSIVTYHILPEDIDAISNVVLEDKMRFDYEGINSIDELYSHHNWVMFHSK
jgi:uncharacterized protein (DUF488 family)